VNTFPREAIQACLDFRDLALSDVEKVILPYDPRLRSKVLSHYLRDALKVTDPVRKLAAVENTVKTQIQAQLFPTRQVESRLAAIGDAVPPIETRSHHLCHAASAFHPFGIRGRSRPHRRREGRVRRDSRLARPPERPRTRSHPTSIPTASGSSSPSSPSSSATGCSTAREGDARALRERKSRDRANA